MYVNTGFGKQPTKFFFRYVLATTKSKVAMACLFELENHASIPCVHLIVL